MRLYAAILTLAVAAQPTVAGTWLVSLRGRDQRGLDALIARQHDAASPDFERWLTPAEFGRRFGARPHDIRQVSRWLRAGGCRPQRLAGRQALLCRGSRPSPMPSALRGTVTDVFDPTTPPPIVMHVRTNGIQPLARIDGQFFLSPADFPRIYGFGAARAAGIDGNGQVIGIVALTEINPDDLANFRDFFGLPPANLGQQGGIRLPGTKEELEAMLDATWSGAIAPAARVELDAGSMVVDSLARLVNRADIGIISLSIDICGKGPAVRRLIRQAYRLFRQAAAQGQSVLAAAGDTGPISCGRRGTFPLSSSPFVTSVGGTTPAPVLDAQGDATGYGTEVVWNDASGATGGGVSRLPRPRYQSGARRTVPDVAFPAAVLYPLGIAGGVGCCVGGTSAAAPAWAGVIALLNQMRGVRAGFLNPGLYALGRAQRGGGVTAFHDVTEGTNTFGGARGFSARPGYDLVTGWGTVAGDVFFATFPHR